MSFEAIHRILLQDAGFRILLFFPDFLLLLLSLFKSFFILAMKKKISCNEQLLCTMAYTHVSASECLLYLGAIRKVTGFFSGASWFLQLIDVVELSFRKLCHFMIFNQCTRTHFPSSIQSCTPAGVIYHFLSTLGNLYGRKWWAMTVLVCITLILKKVQHLLAVC